MYLTLLLLASLSVTGKGLRANGERLLRHQVSNKMGAGKQPAILKTFKDQHDAVQMSNLWDEKVSVYAVNMDRSKDRWSTLKKIFNVSGIILKRAPGVDGTTLKDVDPKIYDVNYSNYYGFEYKHLKEQHAPILKRVSSKSETACSLSHYGVWKRHEADPYTVIIEDDVKFAEGMGVADLRQAILDMKTNPNIEWLNLSPSSSVNYLKHIRERYGNIQQTDFVTGTTAYILSQRGKYKLLNALPLKGPVDVHMSKILRGHIYRLEKKLMKHPPWGVGSMISHTFSQDYSKPEFTKWIKWCKKQKIHCNS